MVDIRADWLQDCVARVQTGEAGLVWAKQHSLKYWQYLLRDFVGCPDKMGEEQRESFGHKSSWLPYNRDCAMTSEGCHKAYSVSSMSVAHWDQRQEWPLWPCNCHQGLVNCEMLALCQLLNIRNNKIECPGHTWHANCPHFCCGLVSSMSCFLSLPRLSLRWSWLQHDQILRMLVDWYNLQLKSFASNIWINAKR